MIFWKLRQLMAFFLNIWLLYPVSGDQWKRAPGPHFRCADICRFIKPCGVFAPSIRASGSPAHILELGWYGCKSLWTFPNAFLWDKRWKNVQVLPKFHREMRIVVVTICSATSGDRVGIMTCLVFSVVPLDKLTLKRQRGYFWSTWCHLL